MKLLRYTTTFAALPLILARAQVPLVDHHQHYALAEIARCARDPQLRAGLKLHFGNSDVDVHDTSQVAQLQRVFHAANEHRMPIAAHIHANVNKKRPYGGVRGSNHAS